MTVIAVNTTGIFCRPSCTGAPKPANVTTLPGARDALAAGYRPCLRCSPMADAEDPAWARAAIHLVETDPTPARQVWQVATAVGASSQELGRWIEGRHGTSFAEYLRLRRVTPVLRAARTAKRRIPGRGRVVTTLVETPLGPMLAGATDAGICLLEFTDRPMLPTQLRTVVQRHGPMKAGAHPHLDRLRTELREYFAGRRTTFDLPVDAPGSPFQRTIWDGLRAVPFGETVTYAELARTSGRPGAARAVGRANGSNRVAIVIPCHRVVAAGGALGGYGGGLDRKRRLLELERASLARDAEATRVLA